MIAFVMQAKPLLLVMTIARLLQVFAIDIMIPFYLNIVALRAVLTKLGLRSNTVICSMRSVSSCCSLY